MMQWVMMAVPDDYAPAEPSPLLMTPIDELQRRRLEVARRIYEMRRARGAHLPESLFGEPAWDMLLTLYILGAEGEAVSVKGVVASAAVPATTALRWQGALVEEGLIERIPDHADKRRVFVRLTDKGRAGIELVLDSAMRPAR